MKTETYLYNGKKEETVFQTKLDLFRGDENKINGFKVTFWDKVFECVITDEEDKPSIDIRKTSEEEKVEIRKSGYSNVGKKWSEDEEKELIEHFYYYNGDIQQISKLMERTERSIQIRLEMLELIKKV